MSHLQPTLSHGHGTSTRPHGGIQKASICLNATGDSVGIIKHSPAVSINASLSSANAHYAALSKGIVSHNSWFVDLKVSAVFVYREREREPEANLVRIKIAVPVAFCASNEWFHFG